MEDQRALLDMLMGKTRNLPENLKGELREISFHDHEVCKFFMCGLCPYSLFSNTKSDLGPCPKQICENSDALELRTKYNRLSQEQKDDHGYEYELMLYLEDLVRGCDQRIAKNKKRSEKDMQISEESLTKVAALESQLRRLNEECVAAAEEGDIDKSMGISKQIDVIKEEMNELSNPKDQKITTVCEVSGNFMSTRDNDERMRAHFEGKQYIGWKLVRDKHKELKARNLRPPNYSSRNGNMSISTNGNRRPIVNRSDERKDRGRDSTLGPNERETKTIAQREPVPRNARDSTNDRDWDGDRGRPGKRPRSNSRSRSPMPVPMHSNSRNNEYTYDRNHGQEYSRQSAPQSSFRQQYDYYERNDEWFSPPPGPSYRDAGRDEIRRDYYEYDRDRDVRDGRDDYRVKPTQPPPRAHSQAYEGERDHYRQYDRKDQWTASSSALIARVDLDTRPSITQSGRSPRDDRSQPGHILDSRIKEVAIGKFTASNVGPASRVVAPDSAASTSISISLEEGEEPDED